MNRNEQFLMKVESYMWKKYGSATVAEFDPLDWYYRTGRASSAFMRLLLNQKPYVIGRLLHKGGTHEEAIDRICNFIGYDRNRA